MAKRKKAEPKVEVETGITVEQHLKNLGLLGGEPEPEPEPEPEELFEVNLFDAVPVQINGSLQHLAKGSQKVSKQIYNVLKDANLV